MENRNRYCPIWQSVWLAPVLLELFSRLNVSKVAKLLQ
nr:hypothetical protein Iba_chr04aCG19450 [Ipomoea batatas]GMC86879.1 hypothetical protein Iba_chr04dCG14950 [Ipomoea batatas]